MVCQEEEERRKQKESKKESRRREKNYKTPYPWHSLIKWEKRKPTKVYMTQVIIGRYGTFDIKPGVLKKVALRQTSLPTGSWW